MANDFGLTPDALAHLPGAPFTQADIDAAVADVRAAAEWHIFPQRAETVLLDVVSAERRLRLPTRKLVSVDAVRNADAGAVIDPTGYRVSVKFAQVKRNGGYWPSGFGAVEVDMTHGYSELPLDLLPVVAESVNLTRRDQSIRSVRIDDFQQSFGATSTPGPIGVYETLARYSLRGQPLYGLGIA